MMARRLFRDGSMIVRAAARVQQIVRAGDDALVVVWGGGVVRVKRWSPAAGTIRREGSASLRGATGVVAPVGRRLFVTDGRGPRVDWCDLDGDAAGTFTAPFAGAAACVPSADGRFVAVWPDAVRGGAAEIVVVRCSDAAEVGRVVGARRPSFADDGRSLFVAHWDGLVRWFDTGDGTVRELNPLDGTSSSALDGRAGPRWVAVANEEQVAVCDLEAGRVLEHFECHLRLVGVELGGDGILLDEGDDAGVWSTDGWGEYIVPRDPAVAPTFSGRGDVLTCQGDMLEVINRGGRVAPVSALTWSNDGRLMASLSRFGGVRVWDVAAGASTWTLEGPVGGGHLAFAPDRPLLYLATPYELVAWDLRTGAEAWRRCLVGAIRGIAVSPDGALLAVVGEDNEVTLLALSSEGPPAVALQRVDGAPVALRWADADTAETLRRTVDGTFSLARHGRDGALRSQRALTLPGDADRSSSWPASRAGAAFDGEAQRATILGGAGIVAIDLDAGDTRVLVGADPWTSLLCAGAGLVVFGEAMRGPRERPPRVRVVGLRDGATRCVVREGRTPTCAALSPDGTRLAVAFHETGVEVFALDG